MSTPDPPFPLYGPLPGGQVAIEASAGTGKTYTLAVLATRFLAERDVAPSELLIVTFTRAATAELRSRIRTQLVSTAAALGSDATDFGADELSADLAREDRRIRYDRLERAVADFDAAAISTMHSFAAQVRSTLGVSSAIDPDARLTTDAAELVRHACADALATASASGVPYGELPTLTALVDATERFVGDPDMDLEPLASRPGAAPEHVRLRELVLASEANLLDRRQASGTMGFDDVLSQLRASLGDRSAASVIAALRSRFSVVLIDEFQDTDRVQWEIFSTLFGADAPDSTLVLVGDPKQAIYRFRGADIGVYLEAVGDAPGTERYTLDRNWRSDGAAIAAMQRFFAGATFGDEAIGFVPVRASTEHEDQRMRGAGGESLSGLAVRVAVGDWLPRAKNLPNAPKTGRIVYRDMVAHIRDLLDGATIPVEGGGGALRRLEPSDVAVLVTSGGQARAAQNALRLQGVPAVVAGAGSVLSSWASDQVRLLLAAMERPADVRRVRAYALSWFEAWSPERVARATDVDLAALQERLAEWTAQLAVRPVAEVLASVWDDTDVVARVLGYYDGDRNVTDLDHLAELLHDERAPGHVRRGRTRLLPRPPTAVGGGPRDRRRRGGPADRVRGPGSPDHDGVEGEGPAVPGGLPADAVAPGPELRRGRVHGPGDRPAHHGPGQRQGLAGPCGGAGPQGARPHRGGLRAAAPPVRGPHPRPAPHRPLVGRRLRGCDAGTQPLPVRPWTRRVRSTRRSSPEVRARSPRSRTCPTASDPSPRAPTGPSP